MKGIVYIELDLSKTPNRWKADVIPDFRFENRKERLIVILGYGVDVYPDAAYLGTEVTLMVYAQAWDSQVQCLLVDLPPSIPRYTSTPHITFSWANGATPAAASDMLNNIGSTYEVNRLYPFFLAGVLKFKAWDDGRKEIF